MAVKSKSDARSRRHLRLRKKVVGTEARPRLVVTRSARHVFVQLVDDSKGHTVASASTLESDLRTFDGDKTAKARKVGELVAERAGRRRLGRRVRPRWQPLRGPCRSDRRGRPRGGLNL
jgi:large subunit ribosomal protein L18